ncbi:hypothetical protein BCV70DRAFT_201938 [Testicularia cyperi]|uniref:N-acetyltransferase domain-containing protein n=1 Tax=Testicularia cyperi TaxID=1882483 RepID=A0A317XMM1_9BASI|nr:hypothetical protein BCV70DRAFT_201938 [Testicularia cyperi]
MSIGADSQAQQQQQQQQCESSSSTSSTSTSTRTHRFRVARPAQAFQTAIESGELQLHDADETDVDFVLHSFDSALPYLLSIGSEAQWGTLPFSAKPDVVALFTQQVQQSWTTYTAAVARGKEEENAGPGWYRVVILEVRLTNTNTNTKWRRVAAMCVGCGIPDYVPLATIAQPDRDIHDFVYLKSFIVDRRSGTLARGSGAKLVPHAVQLAQSLAKKTLWVDCWKGNRDKLISYYESLGFEQLKPNPVFEVPDKHGKGLPWTGCLLKMSAATTQ